jgi:phage FluMu protein Com
MYDMNPKNWRCAQCGESIAHALLKFVYQEMPNSMPEALQFYCPHCRVTLEIYLTWQKPTVRSVKVAHPPPAESVI